MLSIKNFLRTLMVFSAVSLSVFSFGFSNTANAVSLCRGIFLGTSEYFYFCAEEGFECEAAQDILDGQDVYNYMLYDCL